MILNWKTTKGDARLILDIAKRASELAKQFGVKYPVLEADGWFNYETWLVNLWMDNEEGSQRYWADRAQEIYDGSEADDTFTKEEQAALDLSDAIKDEYEEAQLSQ